MVVGSQVRVPAGPYPIVAVAGAPPALLTDFLGASTVTVADSGSPNRLSQPPTHNWAGSLIGAAGLHLIPGSRCRRPVQMSCYHSLAAGISYWKPPRIDSCD